MHIPQVHHWTADKLSMKMLLAFLKSCYKTIYNFGSVSSIINSKPSFIQYFLLSSLNNKI